MKIIVIYDSLYGNTEKIAQTIATALRGQGELILLRVGDLQADSLASVDMLVVGSPTQGFRPTEAVRAFLKALPEGQLRGVRVAAFDTRFTQTNINSNRLLRLLVKKYGYAAEPIATGLEKKGGSLVKPAQAFYVAGKEGPLLDGELERAVIWAASLTS